MYIEQLSLKNFRCFGEPQATIDLDPGLTTFIGVNGAGKTSVLQALQRLFGITGEQRRIRRQDFHVPSSEDAAPTERTLTLDAILAFPELEAGRESVRAVPEFFHQMAADSDGRLRCRLRLEATWTDDGSLEGSVEQKYFVVRTLGCFTEADCIDLKPADRARIQMIYVPASRDGASQVAAFLRGRLWRAINWSKTVKETFDDSGTKLNEAFASEPAVDKVVGAVTRRWQEVHMAGTDTTPLFRPVDLRFQEFIRKVGVMFRPDEVGRERPLEDLSDGQRSLFHLAMTAATIDIECSISEKPSSEDFHVGGVPLPALTLIAVEEPENNLAPFYLSRIIRQIEDLTKNEQTQAIISSHSPSILSRVDPSRVRHFRLDAVDRTARVHSIRLPDEDEEASKYIREAVKAYPELYFARFVVLGEGASEEIVLPCLAEAMGLDIDRSFVAIVPLGGRHVNHLWRLLTDLEIPYATLLDLDWGRQGGGWGRIKSVCAQLLAVGTEPKDLFLNPNPDRPDEDLAAFDNNIENFGDLTTWANFLRSHNVFFCTPLDLDFSMLRAFPAFYQTQEPGRLGPSQKGDPRTAVLGDEGRHDFYESNELDQALRWYRYLFLGRGKPSTHVRVLSKQPAKVLEQGIPEELSELLKSVSLRLGSAPPPPPQKGEQE